MLLIKLSKIQGHDALRGKHFAFLNIGKYLAGIPANKNSICTEGILEYENSSIVSFDAGTNTVFQKESELA